jgi:hypothetical protein
VSLLLLAALLAPEFHRDVLPVFERRCVQCHRAGESAPMSLDSYRNARPWAKAIREAVLQKRMPPWFAVEGKFANDPSLTKTEIETIVAWVDQGAREGRRGRIAKSGVTPAARGDLSLAGPSFLIPAKGVVPYQYLILNPDGTGERWITRAAFHNSERRAVHHVVAYVRAAGSPWLATQPRGKWFSLPPAEGFTTADVVAVFTPGSGVMELPKGMAKKLPAGADIVLQVHYTPYGKVSQDRAVIDLWFSSAPPDYSVLTLQLNKIDIRIPPFEKDHREVVGGTMPGDALLLSFLPHMHLRGKSFEYRIVGTGGASETLLKVSPYHFYWQLPYRLAEPRLLKKGTRLQAEAHYDNSAANPFNPDPSAEVTYGEPSSDEMFIGFFDVAVPVSVDKESFFLRR